MSDDTLLPGEPSQQDAPAQEGQPPSQPQEQPEAKFFWKEGVAGDGDAPEWYKADKYKSISDQAKAYVDLEKRFGGFAGAPQEYQIPEEVDREDTFVKTLTELGKASHMGQEMFSKLLDLGEQIMSTKDEIDREAQLAALGPEANQRIANIDGFLRNNLGDKYDDLKTAVRDAKTVELIEELVKATAPAKLASGPSAPVSIPTQSDIERMMQERDPQGRVIYHYSQARQKEVQAAIARMVSH